MRTVRTVVAVCATFALAACGTSAAGDGVDGTGARSTTASSSSASASAPSPTIPEATPVLRFGSEHRFPSGVVITVSSPNVFQPSDDAYPTAPRAVAFGIEILNEGKEPYRLSNLSVHATLSDEEIKQVRDTTRGYNGITDADRDIAPGKSVSLNLAFALTELPGTLELTLRPDSAEPAQVVFTGSV